MQGVKGFKEFYELFRGKCSTPNCNGKYFSMGCCRSHYRKLSDERRLAFTQQRIEFKSLCKIENCGETHWGKGLCKKHYDGASENKAKANARWKRPHRAKQRKKKYPKGYYEHYQRGHTLSTKYGLTRDDYMAMIRIQNNKCRICNKELVESRRTHIDHDHATGKVRGILCATCNAGLGYFKDSIDNLRAAIKYLKRTK